MVCAFSKGKWTCKPCLGTDIWASRCGLETSKWSDKSRSLLVSEVVLVLSIMNSNL